MKWVGQAADRKPSARRVRTHRSSEVNGDEDFLLALVSFSWRGIHSRSLGLSEIGAELDSFDTLGAEEASQN